MLTINSADCRRGSDHGLPSRSGWTVTLVGGKEHSERLEKRCTCPWSPTLIGSH